MPPIRVQADSSDFSALRISNPETDFAQPKDQPQQNQTPAPSPYKTGGIPTRVQFDGDGNATVTQPGQASSSNLPPVSTSGATARTATGLSVSLTACGPDAVVNIPGWGESTAKAYEALGLLQWDPLESTCRHASLSIL